MASGMLWKQWHYWTVIGQHFVAVFEVAFDWERIRKEKILEKKMKEEFGIQRRQRRRDVER
jgi:hypothetical protein